MSVKFLLENREYFMLESNKGKENFRNLSPYYTHKIEKTKNELVKVLTSTAGY